MNKAKSKFIGVLLFCTILGLVSITPATSVAPSWIGDGKYARYLGGAGIDSASWGQPGLLVAEVMAAFNWTMSDTSATGVTITGGWNISISVTFNSTPAVSFTLGTKGNERTSLDGQITSMGGYDLFGLEQGPTSVLWNENLGALHATNVSIGGRHCVYNEATILNFTLSGMEIPSIPVIEYYDAGGTGVLMALNIILNITGLMGGGGGLGPFASFGLVSFPIVMTSSNVVPFAWNIGGDTTLWLEAVGILVAVSALFAAIIYARKR